MTTQTPEKFVVGETVSRFVGEDKWDVVVTEVYDDAVTIFDWSQEIVFTPRLSDGRYVKLGSPDYEVMPDMIAHSKPQAPTKVSLANRFMEFFA